MQKYGIHFAKKFSLEKSNLHIGSSFFVTNSKYFVRNYHIASLSPLEKHLLHNSPVELKNYQQKTSWLMDIGFMFKPKKSNFTMSYYVKNINQNAIFFKPATSNDLNTTNTNTTNVTTAPLRLDFISQMKHIVSAKYIINKKTSVGFQYELNPTVDIFNNKISQNISIGISQKLKNSHTYQLGLIQDLSKDFDHIILTAGYSLIFRQVAIDISYQISKDNIDYTDSYIPAKKFRTRDKIGFSISYQL